MSWRDTVLRVMRVPPTPAPPPGSPPRVFRAAPNFFALRVIGWSIKQAVAVAGLLFAVFAFHRADVFNSWTERIFLAAEVLGALALTAEILFGWMIVRLDFELRWYMLSDRALRIREGILTVTEKTIVLANIQNIAVRQGPLQRVLGIADVEVKTAGGGGKSDMDRKGRVAEPMHVAYFRGVDNAEEIRDLLREGVRAQRDSGLGDLDDDEVGSGAGAAVVELLAAARELRAVVETGKR
ncbi:MAG TPA: PH domain-containing protein [Thermoanaerobaculia bacterium]|nr:PH domain-containing protein [Thermoanaerobaculia bacterium]